MVRNAAVASGALAAATIALLLVACRGTSSPGGTDGVARSDAASGGVPWKDMGRAQRIGHMKRVVLPTMKERFTQFDPDRYADFTCATCHGEGARDKSYAMPNPELPPLPATPDGFAMVKAEHPEITAFMADGVVPTMAALLGEKPWDPRTRDGFGCFRCHTTERP